MSDAKAQKDYWLLEDVCRVDRRPNWVNPTIRSGSKVKITGITQNAEGGQYADAFGPYVEIQYRNSYFNIPLACLSDMEPTEPPSHALHAKTAEASAE